MSTTEALERTPLLASQNDSDDTENQNIETTTISPSTRSLVLKELGILTRSTLPTLGTYVLEYSLVMVAVVSIGHISTISLAAITLGSMTATISGFSVLQGLCAALDTMLPPAWSSAEPRLVGLWTQRMTVVMAIALVPIMAIWLNAESILLLLRQDPEVAKLAAVYLKWMCIGLPAYAFNSISRRYFQCQGLFDVPTRIIIIVSPINIALNYLLVWGPDSVRLGFIGAPISTSITFYLISLMSLVYGVFRVPRTAWHPVSSKMFTNLGVLTRLGLAGIGQTASEWWAWELAGLASSFLGPVALAAQSALIVSSDAAFQASFALSIAASVRIGNLLGERDSRRAAVAAKTSIFMALVLALITSTMFLVFRKSWGHLFNDDPKVVTLVASVLPLVALFQVFDSTSGVTSGIIRACGKQVIGAVLNLSGYYLLGLPMGISLAFAAKMGLYGLWMGFVVALMFNALASIWISLRLDWDEEVVKAIKRLDADHKVSLDGQP